MGQDTSLSRDRAAQILRDYPWLFNYMRYARANIIHRYRQDPFGVGRPSGIKDPTGQAAVNLIGVTASAAVVAAVRQWIDDELPAESRPLLLDVWRNLPWSVIAKKHRREVSLCQEDFAFLSDLLEQYLARSAGLASAPAGNVFALGREELQEHLGTS